MTLTLLHTANVHVRTFDALRDRIAPKATLRHVVQKDWLEEARETGITSDLTGRMATVIEEAEGPVICTCTTLGPAAAALGAVRIDQPMMREAARIGGVAIMAYTLDSTRGPSRDLFLAQGGQAKLLRMLDLTAAWPLFEAGDWSAFHHATALQIRANYAAHGGDVVILAQASMAGAATLLGDLPVPVLSSPELALRSGLGL